MGQIHLLHKFSPMPYQNSGCERSSAQGMEEAQNEFQLGS